MSVHSEGCYSHSEAHQSHVVHLRIGAAPVVDGFVENLILGVRWFVGKRYESGDKVADEKFFLGFVAQLVYNAVGKHVNHVVV